ncbi:retrovirus-related pol polyprotein from transposon TNT 1-94 [Tanacetum coccineum]
MKIDGECPVELIGSCRNKVQVYRSVRMPQLHTSLHFHLTPIIMINGSSRRDLLLNSQNFCRSIPAGAENPSLSRLCYRRLWGSRNRRALILGWAYYLDAFSSYPLRTWLPSVYRGHDNWYTRAQPLEHTTSPGGEEPTSRCQTCPSMLLTDELKESSIGSQLEGFVDPDHPTHVYRLKKALYGLKQAHQAWYDTLSQFLLDNKFSKGAVDLTLFSPSHPQKEEKRASYQKHLEALKRSTFKYSQRKPLIGSLITLRWDQAYRLRFVFNKIPLYCDNRSAIALCCNNVHHSRSKYIDIRHHFIREKVKKGVVELYFVTMDYQLADIFTKALPRERFGFPTHDWDEVYFRLQPAFQIEESMSPKRRLFLTMGDSVLPGMGYFISMQPRSNVRFSALFLDPEEKALTIVINLCLMGKTSGFERPRALVLQILWGIVNQAHIDYAERMWEEFTQSIHTFIEDKKNLVHHIQGKKKDTLIVIPRYLKFSAKGTKREVFGMPIPNDLIAGDIRGEQYYNAYLEKVAKHQRYLAGEEVSDPDSHAPKLAKATKPKASKQSKPLAPIAATKKPKPAPAKPQENKRKLVTETSEAPSPAKRSKAGKVLKKRTKKSSLQLVDEFVDEGVPENEPKIGDEEADLQKAVEESLKLQRKKSPTDQYIFQRHTSTQTKPTGHDESSSLYAEIRLTNSEIDSDEEVPGIVAGVQDEGQAGPNPGEHDEGQAGPNPGDAEVPRNLISHVENLKLPTEGEVRLEEPASSAGTLSSLQNLDKELSFADQFLVEKSQEDEPEKTNMNKKHIGELKQHMADMVEANQALEERLDKQGVKYLYKLDVSLSYIRDLPEAEWREILHHPQRETLIHPKTPPGSPPHQLPPPPLLAGSSRTSGASGSSQLPPPPPPPSTYQSDQSTSTADPSSSKTAASAEYTAWTTTDTRLKTSVSSIPEELHMDDDMTPDEHFVEEPVEIMEWEIKRLKRSRIPLVKVRWNSRRGPEFTWEREDSFKQKYPQLFTNQASSSTTRS